MVRIDMDENHDIWKGTTERIIQGTTELIPRDKVFEKVDVYLRESPLNIGKDEYCYIRIVQNHLEIGRAKITLEK